MRILLVALCALSLAACAHDPVGITGNGLCKPSQDLPKEQSVKPVPEVKTNLDDLWAMFLNERSEHKGHTDQYNSLYSECVSAPK